MKRVNYIFNLYTNINADVPFLLRDAEEKILKGIQDYKRPEAVLETTANGKVTVSLDTTDVEVNDFGDCCFFGYLICNDDVEKTGISDSIYDWFNTELKEFVNYISKLGIKVDPIAAFKEECGGYLIIHLDDVDNDFLDGCIDTIEPYDE